MSVNHYDTLGVSQKSTDAEIKKAYRVLSLKYHPDRNQSPDAATKIREINDAYETLSDSAKRRQYDMELTMGAGGFPFPPGMGMGGMNMGGMPFSHMASMDEMNDINGLFQMLFGGAGGGRGPEIHVFHGSDGFPSGFQGGFPGGIPGIRQRGINQKPPPILRQVQITLEQAFSGYTLPVEIERWTIVGDLKVQEEETIYITVPPGIDDNEVIIVKDKGNVTNEMSKGDVKINIQVVNNTVFKRHGLDLIFRKGISLKESLCGFSFEIHHLNGKQLNLNNKQNSTIVKPNFRKTIPGLGLQRDGVVGSMIIEFEVEFPDILSLEQISRLSEIL